MRVLVTGASGFVGSYLVRALRADGDEVVGTSTETEDDYVPVDVRDEATVADVIGRTQPDRVFHLAAQSSAALSWKEPALTYEVNVTGTHFLLEALRQYAPHARVLLPCTSDQYGRIDPAICPVTEDAPQRPVSPYAASKMAQEAVGRMYYEGYGLPVLVTRAFMHIGPGQPASFATADWARQIARAEAGLQEPFVTVGNLDLQREFGDVRDVVDAYRTVLDNGTPGEAYNVATGDARPLRDALDILRDLASVPIEVRVDKAKFRPADPPLLQGSAAKLHSATGWKPQHRLEDTLEEVLSYWRAEVGSSTRSPRS